MSNKTIAVVAGLAIVGMAGYIGFKVASAKKETARLREQADRAVAEYKAETARVWGNATVRIEELNLEMANALENHEEVMAVLNAARVSGAIKNAANAKILTDMVTNKITPVEATLRMVKTRRDAAKATRKVPHLRAVS